jgi:cob(I)alamin adenosyltransferase
MSKIYTRLGDQGNTSLIGGISINKSEKIFEVIGNLDELNASIGVAKSILYEKENIEKLEKVQNILFYISSEIADKKGLLKKEYQVSEDDIKTLENDIDLWESELPDLVNFLFPGSNQVSALLHLSRTVCRRTERSIVEYSKVASLRPLILKYLNRLSDWLFVIARITTPKEDKIWDP